MDESFTSDFKKWIVYSSYLKSMPEIQNLYNAVNLVSREGDILCEKIKFDEEIQYTVTSGTSDILKINEEGRVEFLSYLELHYLKPETTVIELNKPGLRSDQATSTNETKFAVSIKKLISHNIYKQAFRFSILALLIFQIIVIPQYVFDLHLPKILIIGFSFTVLLGLSFVSTNLYKRHFAAEVRHRFVNRLTIVFCLLVYSEYWIQLTLIDLLKGTAISVLPKVIELVIFLFLGLFIGLVLSAFNYFLNGGKMISPPGKA